MRFKKIKNGFLRVFAASLALCGLCACTGGKTDSNTNTVSDTDAGKAEPAYVQITAEEAKRLMDTQTDYIILDVRTEEEFKEGHIAGAVCIPDTEIETRAEKELPNKNQLILVYCRSGRRSKLAATALANLGYTNVQEFGGILSWPYETVK